MPFFPLGQVGSILYNGQEDAWSRAGILMEPDRYIRSRNYDVGVTGWTINADGTAEFNSISLVTSLYSADWDGTIPIDLTTEDTGASDGWALDAVTGNVQIEGNMWLGGTLTLTAASSPKIQVGTSAPYFTLQASPSSNSLDFFSGHADEITPGIIDISVNGVFVQTNILSPTLEAVANNVTWGQLQLGAYVDGSLGFATLEGTAQGSAGASVRVGASQIDLSGTGDATATVEASVSGDGDAIVNIRAVHNGSGINQIRYRSDSHSFRNVLTTEYANISANGLLIDGGSAASPFLAFRVDTNTGIYRIGADTLGVATAGVERIRVASSGNVLIGGLTTRKILLVNGTGGVASPQYTFYQDENTGVYSDAADHLKFTAGGTQHMEIDDAANSVTVDNAGFGVGVGFGTALTPGYFYNRPPTTGAAANATWVLASGTIYYLNRVSSSRRYKSLIETADWLANAKLRPVKYWSNTDEEFQYGLIAEEVVEELGVSAGSLDGEGRVENYSDRAVIATLIAKVNRLEEQMAQLRSA